MQEPVELIIVEPTEADLGLVESLGRNPAFRITSLVEGDANQAATWLENRGVQKFDDLGNVSRLLPGVVVVFLGEGLPTSEVVERATSHGLSILNREAAGRFAARPATARRAPGTRDIIARYRRLLEDYFPTSRNSSTSVKLAACLTEAMTIWDAEGGAILSLIKSDTLAVSTQRGLSLGKDATLRLEPASALFKAAGRGKQEVLNDFPGEILPGVQAPSAMCISIKSATDVYGVMVLWSSVSEAFTDDDVASCSLFATYVALLSEVDELGERLGANLVTDPLTGLHNRRQFETRLEQELLRAKRYTLNLSLIVFDVDELAAYNRSCGQMLGNLALSDIASILTKGTREVDFVARIGGDEFAVILPETNRLGAVRLADRLREEISSYPFPVPQDQASMNLTVSAGVSNFPSAAGEDDDVMAASLIALELARKRGSNSIELFKKS